jgi:hypothetical protein
MIPLSIYLLASYSTSAQFVCGKQVKEHFSQFVYCKDTIDLIHALLGAGMSRSSFIAIAYCLVTTNDEWSLLP